MVLEKEERHTLMENKTSLDIEPHKYSQLVFDKVAKAIQWRGDSLFKKRYWTSIYKKINLDTDLTA